MSATGPQLRDIHVPQVSWWPPALGWWLLAALVLFAIIAGAWAWLRSSPARATRRAARRELDELSARYARDGDAVAFASGLSRLLRRIALVVQADAAAREGRAWREFLASRGRAAFTEEQLDVLVVAPYRDKVSLDVDALVAATRRWYEHVLRPRVLIARHSP
ncbi:MAG TPA: DUF4381 domain-containing protein [Rhodanobacteraceae bacterium]|nr:DUF4381 domain-containing protein [Rhodanobacteraceae bacterium]